MRILLTDDEIVALNALKNRVDWAGYGFDQVLTARDVSQARAELEMGPIDLVISDIEMPGESGLDLFEHIKLYYPVTECIFVTCHSDFQYMKKAMKLGSLDYILKPIDYEELDEAILSFKKRKSYVRDMELISSAIKKVANRRDTEVQKTEDAVEKAKQYIQEHIQENIYVDDIAGEVHLNAQYFMRLFKKETGCSILEYMTRQRISLAEELLKNTDYSINFISDCVGYENYSYFTKIFKRYVGVTPSAYRSGLQ